jgi:hypothetical protein
MQTVRQLSIAERLAALAAVVAGVAAVLGFVPGVYRDPRPLIVQSHGQDLASLLFGLPLLAVGLWLAARGSLRGRLVALGALGYLLYPYTVYAFVADPSRATAMPGWPGTRSSSSSGRRYRSSRSM